MGDGRRQYQYNTMNRLSQVTDSQTNVQAIYTYNYLGQRVRKQLMGSLVDDVRYVYASDGRLLGEYDSSGIRIKEYIYHTGNGVSELIAQINEDGTALYIHTDHLATPRLATEQTQSIVWRWDSDAFGNALVNEDPDNNAQIMTLNHRFPGQYYDQESGLHYNYFRYYDPAIGRYITSDPTGLTGGLNTYAYVAGNPLYWIDPFGLAKAGDVVFFNWSRGNHPRHAAIVTQVDANGNATHAFGAWGDNRAFHEVDLSSYNGGITDNIIGYGDMTNLNSSDLDAATWDWFGRPVGIDPTIDDWSGYYGAQCIDATTAEDGFSGPKLRDAMRDDFNKDPSKYKPIPGDPMKPDPNDPWFYRKNPWLKQYFQNTNRYDNRYRRR